MPGRVVLWTAAVFAPALLLGLLAWRNARDQGLLLERRTALLYQQQADRLAGRAREQVERERADFVAAAERLIAERGVAAAADAFATLLPAHWPDARVAFAATPAGAIRSPTATEAAAVPALRAFLAESAELLARDREFEYYPTGSQMAQQAIAIGGKAAKQLDTQALRNVQAANPLAPGDPAASRFAPWAGDFSTLVANGTSGAFARFVRDRLDLHFWYRPPAAPDLVLGAIAGATAFGPGFASLLAEGAPAADEEICLALLDDRALPVATSRPDCRPDWRRPFVSSEVGEALPHWEAAVYLRHPERLAASARTSSLALLAMVALALAAIAVGSWLLQRELGRELALARKKSDFVARVSHELRTPLTSIRMFSDLLRSERTLAPEKRVEYLAIIGAESERLTRLVDRVLDFSRLERGKRNLARERLELRPLLDRLVAAHRAELGGRGLSLRHAGAPGSCVVVGDADAIAQVLANLVSNAEKFAGASGEIAIDVASREGRAAISVADRGPGIPRTEIGRIFEPFERGPDETGTATPGTGLGLAIARGLAREMGGDLVYRPRPGGGSVFTLQLPLASRTATAGEA